MVQKLAHYASVTRVYGSRLWKSVGNRRNSDYWPQASGSGYGGSGARPEPYRAQEPEAWSPEPVPRTALPAVARQRKGGTPHYIPSTTAVTAA